MVEAGESKQIVVLKTRNLMIFQDAQNAKNSKNAANWNVSGTQPQAARTSRWSTRLGQTGNVLGGHTSLLFTSAPHKVVAPRLSLSKVSRDDSIRRLRLPLFQK